MLILTEVVGGPKDGEMLTVLTNTFDALPEIENDHLWGYNEVRPKLTITRYRKEKAFFIFNNKYYYREFFVCNIPSQDKALKKFSSYFNTVFKK